MSESYQDNQTSSRRVFVWVSNGETDAEIAEIKAAIDRVFAARLVAHVKRPQEVEHASAEEHAAQVEHQPDVPPKKKSERTGPTVRACAASLEREIRAAGGVFRIAEIRGIVAAEHRCSERVVRHAARMLGLDTRHRRERGGWCWLLEAKQVEHPTGEVVQKERVPLVPLADAPQIGRARAISLSKDTDLRSSSAPCSEDLNLGTRAGDSTKISSDPERLADDGSFLDLEFAARSRASDSAKISSDLAKFDTGGSPQDLHLSAQKLYVHHTEITSSGSTRTHACARAKEKGPEDESSPAGIEVSVASQGHAGAHEAAQVGDPTADAGARPRTPWEARRPAFEVRPMPWCEPDILETLRATRTHRPDGPVAPRPMESPIPGEVMALWTSPVRSPEAIERQRQIREAERAAEAEARRLAEDPEAAWTRRHKDLLEAVEKRWGAGVHYKFHLQTGVLWQLRQASLASTAETWATCVERLLERPQAPGAIAPYLAALLKSENDRLSREPPKLPSPKTDTWQEARVELMRRELGPQLAEISKKCNR